MDERIQKYFEGELSGPERLKLLREVEADPILRTQFVEYQNMQTLLNLSFLEEDRETGLSNYYQFDRLKKRRQSNRFILRMMQYAAVVALLIISSCFGTAYYIESRSVMASNSLYVPAGQRACLTLQDGTEVWLNARSTLVYPSQFKGAERKVSVTGEAFFKVAKDARMPFVVSTGDLKMKVLGTQFNVCAYPGTDFIETSLIEGSVKVYNDGAEEKGVILKSNEKIIFKDGQMTVGQITFPSHFLWKEGIICFENENLINLIRKLEIYYDVSIVVKNPTLSGEYYTGKFRQRDGIESILRVIQQIHKFNIKKDADKNIITLE